MSVTADDRIATIGGARFHPLWLRDNCPCPECRHESGQRLLDTRSLPDDLSVVAVDGDNVTFSDGHVSVFDPEWLRAQANGGARGRRLWDATVVLPVARYGDVAGGGGALRDW